MSNLRYSTPAGPIELISMENFLALIPTEEFQFPGNQARSDGKVDVNIVNGDDRSTKTIWLTPKNKWDLKHELYNQIFCIPQKIKCLDYSLEKDKSKVMYDASVEAMMEFGLPSNAFSLGSFLVLLAPENSVKFISIDKAEMTIYSSVQLVQPKKIVKVRVSDGLFGRVL
jgi:hypothetical protein